MDLEPVVRPRRYGFDYLLTNNQRGGRLLAIEYLNVKFVPCAGYPTLTMTIIDEATKRPVSVIPMGAEACFTMANGRCPGGQASCEVKFRLVRYTAPRSQIETTPLPGGGFAQRTVLYATRLPESNSDRPHFRFPSNTSGYFTDLHDPL
ncbi:hypothetical protein KKG46_03280 [Patescibacteria group bacterium]|nr:hypothetical protein [Patescibacteria group bacterium]